MRSTLIDFKFIKKQRKKEENFVAKTTKNLWILHFEQTVSMLFLLKANHPVYGDIKGNFYGTCRRLDDPPKNENFCEGLVGRRATKI